MKRQPVAIITGAAGGIGVQLVKKFAKEGWSIALVDIDQVKLGALERELTELTTEVLVLAGDLGSHSFVASITPAVLKKWGRVDVLINNAVWRTRETLRTLTVKKWEQTVKVCLTAPAFLTKYVGVAMENMSISGVIINISSIQSQLAGGASPAYTVCKGGIESLTYESAVLFGPKGIRVVGIRPGNIATMLSADVQNTDKENISTSFHEQVLDQTPLKRAGVPEDISSVVFWLCTEGASYITGTMITVDGGYSHNFISYSLKKKQLNEEF